MSKPYLIQGKKVIRGPEVKTTYEGVAPIGVDNTTNLISIDLTDINAELAKKANLVGRNDFTGNQNFENGVVGFFDSVIMYGNGGMNMNNKSLNYVKDPTSPQDAANKRYVDTELKLKLDILTYNKDVQELASDLDKKAEKEYVDTELSKKASLASANTFTGFRNTFEQVGINVSANFVASGQSKAILQLNGNDLEIDTKDGDLSLKGKKLKDVATPTLDNDASNKAYVDDGLALKANNSEITTINTSINTINTELPKKEPILKVFLTPNQTTNGVLATQQTFTLPQNINTLKELRIVVKSSSPLTGITTIPLMIDRSVYGQTIASGNYLVGFQGTKQVRVVLPSSAGINGVVWIYTDLAIRAILGVEGTPLGA